MDRVHLKCQWDSKGRRGKKKNQNAGKQANFSVCVWQMTPLALQSSGTRVNKLTLAFVFFSASAAQLSTGHSGG